MNDFRWWKTDEEGFSEFWPESLPRTPEMLELFRRARFEQERFEEQRVESREMNRHDCLCGEVLTELRAFRKEWKEAMSVLDDDLSALSTGLDTANAGIAGMETEISELLAAQSAGGLTPAQTAQLASLQAKVNAINATIAGTPPFTPPTTSPAPLSLVSILPLSVVPGTTGVVLSVVGTGFVSGSVVNWDGVALVTTFLSSTQLSAAVPDADVSALDPSVRITVSNPDGTSTAALVFVVGAASSAPALKAAQAARTVPGAPQGTHGPGTQ